MKTLGHHCCLQRAFYACGAPSPVAKPCPFLLGSRGADFEFARSQSSRLWLDGRDGSQKCADMPHQTKPSRFDRKENFQECADIPFQIKPSIHLLVQDVDALVDEPEEDSLLGEHLGDLHQPGLHALPAVYGTITGTIRLDRVLHGSKSGDGGTVEMIDQQTVPLLRSKRV